MQVNRLTWIKEGQLLHCAFYNSLSLGESCSWVIRSNIVFGMPGSKKRSEGTHE